MSKSSDNVVCTLRHRNREGGNWTPWACTRRNGR